MKGYIGTIDSLNQLNMALLGENLAMKEQMEAVSQENADLVERQENMEDMLETRPKPCKSPNSCRPGFESCPPDASATRTRADRATCSACVSPFSRTGSPVGNTTLHLRISDRAGNVLPSEDGDDSFSASRTVDYARERLDACIFYEYPDATVTEPYRSGTYLVEILQDNTVIGTTDLVLR